MRIHGLKSDSDQTRSIGRRTMWLSTRTRTPRRVARTGSAVMAALALLSGASAMAGTHPPSPATGAATTTLVSVSRTGGAGNHSSGVDAITPDARFVLFDSQASNLVRGDTNSKEDVFVRDVQAGRTVRVSVATGGRQANADCHGTAISQDGRFVAFESTASDLTRRPDTNGVMDVFLRDRRRGTTTRVSVRTDRGQFSTPSQSGFVSGDGRFIAFSHIINGDVRHTYVRDRSAHTTRAIDRRIDSEPAAISNGGRYVALYAEDHHGTTFFLYLRDRAHSTQVRVPSPDETVSDAVMTPDARYLAFSGLNPSGGGNDAFRWHRGDRHATAVETEPSFFAFTSGISGDGRFVAFSSEDPTLVPGDTNNTTDVFRVDMSGPTTIRASLSDTGAQLPQGGYGFEGNLISGDGGFIAFTTRSRAATTDTNTTADVYLRGPL